MSNYNGWTNVDTWSVAVIIQNDERLYEYMRRMSPTRLELVAKELIPQIQDDIDFSEVNWDELAEDL
jgi:hypothetical protein